MILGTFISSIFDLAPRSREVSTQVVLFFTPVLLILALPALSVATVLRPACDVMIREAIQAELAEHTAVILHTDGYTTGRWLTNSISPGLKPYFDRKSSYETELGHEFVRDLLRLGAEDHWIDMGAGQLRAIVEYFSIRTEARAQVTAINYFAPPGYAHWYNRLDEEARSRLRHLEPVDFLELSARQLRKADLISDVYGALSYTPEFGKALQKALKTLKVGGRLYFTSTDTTFWDADSQELLDMEEFLARVSGVEVRKTTPTSFLLTRTSQDVQVPKLKLAGFRTYTPPSRHYHVLPSPKR